MKTHTSRFKELIKQNGRQLDNIITYEIDGDTVELGMEQLNSITPHYEADILKSVMRQLDIDSNVEIPVGTEINYQFGLLVDGDYEYVNFGNYTVYSVEKQEDTRSWKIVAYDKMLNAMKEYERLHEYVLTEDTEFIEDKIYFEKINGNYVNYEGDRTGNPSSLGLYDFTYIEYPITIREYLNKLCAFIGLEFANASDTFANYDRVINSELFLSEDGSSLNFTFRDVLDQLAGVTASTICINEDNELEIRYINDTNDTIDEEYLKDINVNFGEKFGPVNSIVLSRSAESDSIFLRDDESIEENGLTEIKIVDNQFMNFNDREDYLEDILEQLNGFEYYANDFSSTGIAYYNLCDRYSIVVDGNTYSCIMMNDELEVTQGLVENVHTDIPEDSETDYKKADKTDRKINQAYLIVDKQNQEISSVTETVGEIEGLINSQGEEISALGSRLTQTTQGFTAQVSSLQEQINEGAKYVKTTSVTIDNNGLNVSTDNSRIATVMTNDAFKIVPKDSDEPLAYFGYDNDSSSTVAIMDNLTITNYLTAGNHRVEKFERDGEDRTGFFYIGG